MISHKTIIRTEDDETFLKLFDDPESELTKESRIQYGKYVYSFERLYRNHIHWRCIRYAHLKCKCVMQTSKDRAKLQIYHVDRDHCHPAEHMHQWSKWVIRSLVDETGNVLVQTLGPLPADNVIANELDT